MNEGSVGGWYLDGVPEVEVLEHLMDVLHHGLRA
jgi:hypothetical protein